ncbi:MAG TPA: sulfotransferase [Vitreimonas sp.]|uniref:tetratricopeptide repeat-containing sulfotransferase family protein n=1 Tax=Vitreimonas sp. TaxID=3069702 RepID=UPI002D713843|nr:sulfotransferase [Vitreimonas sp.]HYD87339.1 sulfotransferase [Vitreimonas sp.]
MTPYDPESLRLAQGAVAALSRGDRAGAQSMARQLLLGRPHDPNANLVLGALALEAGDLAAARRHLERAAQAAPNQGHIVNTLGVALRRSGELDGARKNFARAGELGLIDGWRNLGNLEELEHNADASIAAYRRALQLAPEDAASHGALAQAYERRHDLERARTHAERALKSDPRNENARLALAQVRLRQKDYAGAIAAAEPLALSAGASLTNRSLAWGVIGDARDRLDDAAGAFAAFTAGNRMLLEQNQALLNATHLIYHPAGLERMRALAAAADVRAWRAPPAGETPVFLVGFPRSGTTLLDQVLSSHSRIVCIEEREHFANALGGVINDAEKLANLGALSEGEIETVRADYWRRVRAETTVPDGALVVDKLPLNIVVLPLIRRIFPEAKAIFALRDPRDVVLSCFQQRFGMNAAMAQFLDLGAAAAYYDSVMRLMDICRERLALSLHQVRYEDVVADLEAQARALTAFLDLPFEPAMLRYRETALQRDINTPSARQVVQPLYTRSVARWRRYENELAPVLPLLTPWAVRFGYEP